MSMACLGTMQWYWCAWHGICVQHRELDLGDCPTYANPTKADISSLQNIYGVCICTLAVDYVVLGYYVRLQFALQNRNQNLTSDDNRIKRRGQRQSDVD